MRRCVNGSAPMLLLAFDTATDVATSALVWDGEVLGERRSRAATVLADVDALLRQGGVRESQLEGIVAGIGPGSFTGLRIGVATARALASGSGLQLRPVSSLAALAQGIDQGSDCVALPLIDAKRGELFAAAYVRGGELWAPFAARPEEIARRVREAGLAPRAVGDGSIRFRRVLEAAGIRIAPDGSLAHVVRALHVCRLAAEAPGEPPEAVVPEYLRAPDAKPQ